MYHLHIVAFHVYLMLSRDGRPRDPERVNNIAAMLYAKHGDKAILPTIRVLMLRKP